MHVSVTLKIPTPISSCFPEHASGGGGASVQTPQDRSACDAQKHTLTDSNGSHNPFIEGPVTTATCQRRTPLRCIMIPFSRACFDIVVLRNHGPV
ncbi:hypothetical protein M404DRAFT_668806 [Pisolithus tinctorius Marx 270]|uniref:Uncharacterized protein n=1 Tax=Pisolithus tinctorius Marx 270 TaxID=870435 RepID=A0A0C3P565_PISTI|nr:hypothetical protein M404DRAFT_668806 [Pisolithus tinctorius Marx 270]